MCQQIVQFCAGSTKPMVLVGSLLTLLLAGAIGYLACNTNSLLRDIDPQVASDNALSYYLQLLASLYLVLVTILGAFAAHYEEKHSIRALAVICSVNFVLAVAAILMMPSGQELAVGIGKRLEEAKELYDWKDKPKVLHLQVPMTGTIERQEEKALPLNGDQAAAAKGGQPKTRSVRDAAPNKMDAQTATKIWDNLQRRGCCGFANTSDWQMDKIPKSCCAEPKEKEQEFLCSKIDEPHNKPCKDVIGSTSSNLLIVVALIALTNLFLATVTNMSAFRTLHYNEASQNAYS